MGTDKTPFIIKTVPCPNCSTITTNRYFKSDVYTESAKESDQHVTRYTWKDPSFKDYHPPYYFLWFCPSCYYTDVRPDFERPHLSKSNKIKEIKQILSGRHDDVISLLGGGIDYDNMTFESAMNAHLLSIYLQELVPEGERDTRKLGRLYLRTGWLYREKVSSKQSELTAQLGDEGMQLLAQLDEISTGAHSLIEKLRVVIDTEIGERNREISEACAKQLDIMLQGIDEFAGGLEDLKFGLNKISRDTVLSETMGDEPYGDFSCYGDFLKELSKTWKTIPLNEEDCLINAGKYFEECFRKESESVAETHELMELIIEIYVRIKRFNKASDYLKRVMNDLSNERYRLETKLKADQRTLSAIERNMIEARLGFIYDSLKKAQEKQKLIEKRRREQRSVD